VWVVSTVGSEPCDRVACGRCGSDLERWFANLVLEGNCENRATGRARLDMSRKVLVANAVVDVSGRLE